jgi:hypothetical protein
MHRDLANERFQQRQAQVISALGERFYKNIPTILKFIEACPEDPSVAPD